MKPRGIFLCLLLLASPLLQIIAQEPVVTQISVSTNVTGAEVYLNGLLMGTAPMIISPLEPGIWRLTVRKRGYYQEFRMLKVEKGDQKKIFITLIEITGTLVILNAPENAEFLYGEKKTQSRRFLLPEGIHRITIRAFGYIERNIDVSIYQNIETSIDGTLEAAAFEVFSFRSTTNSFNPENPSNLGKAGFSFSVSARGNGRLEITNENNVLIKTIALPSFSTWSQHSYWDGRDNTGIIVPDGKYIATLITNDEKSYTSEIRIDKSIHYPLSGSIWGTSSAGPVELSVVLPQGSYALHVDFALTPTGHMLGCSLVFGFPAHIEAGFRAGILIKDENDSEEYISASIKKSIYRGIVSTALFTRFSYSADDNPQTRLGLKNGLAIGIATGLSKASYAVHGELEIMNGNIHGIPSTDTFSLAGGLTARLFSGPLSASVWTRWESGLFNNVRNEKLAGVFNDVFIGSATLMPGLSLYVIIPQTNLTLNIDIGYAFAKKNQSYFVSTGFGILF